MLKHYVCFDSLPGTTLDKVRPTRLYQNDRMTEAHSFLKNSVKIVALDMHRKYNLQRDVKQLTIIDVVITN